MEKLYMVFYMLEGLETAYQKVFAKSAQEAADKIRAKKEVLDVFAVYKPITDWK